MLRSSARRAVRKVRSEVAAFGLALGKARDELGLLPAMLGYVLVDGSWAGAAKRFARAFVEGAPLGWR